MKILPLVLLLSAVSTAHAETRSPARDATLKIATDGLLQNVVTVGKRKLLLAGAHQFHDLWVRDFAMSVGGLLALSREDVVHDSLDLIFSLQRADGLLPRVIDNHEVTGRTILGSVLGYVQDFQDPLQGWFETENNIIVIDGNAAVPWAASRYLKATRDVESARRWYAGMEKALAYLEAAYGQDGLIGKQPPYADWEDSVGRQGRVAFTNELYLLALQGAADWAELIGRKDRVADFHGRLLRAEAAFIKQFWDPSLKRVLNFDGDDHWTADANFLAAARGIVPKDYATQILDHWPADHSRPMPRTTWPDYPAASKDGIVKLVGIADYHDSLYWIWIGALAAMAESSAGRCADYNRQLETIAATVSADGALYEVYELGADGSTLKHVNRFLYAAEQPFSWSSAMLIEAEQLGCR